MNKYDLYEDESGDIFLLVGGVLMPVAEQKGNGFALPSDSVKPVVTPIMESYRDQPFEFGEMVEVRNDDGEEWCALKFAYFREGSSWPYVTAGGNGWKYARKIQTKITIGIYKYSREEAKGLLEQLKKELGE